MLKKLLIISLYVCIVSCTKETVIYNPVDDKKEDEITHTTGELTIQLENLDVTTRSGWTYDNYFPLNDIMSNPDGKRERGLFNFTLVSFNSDMLLEYHTNQTTALNYYPPAMDNLAKVGNTDFYATPLGTGGITVTTGAHYFYIICNQSKEMSQELGDWLDQKKGTLTKDEFEKLEIKYPIDTLAHKFPGYEEDDNFHSSLRCLMVNSVSPAPNYMASIENATEIPPKANFIRTKIGKLFAKVSLAYVPESGHDRLTNVEYRVINVPNSCYLIPHLIGGQVETPLYEENYESPTYSGCFNKYYTQWFDQKYSLKRIKIEDGIPIDNNDCGEYDENNLDDGGDDYQGWQIASTETDKTYLYCMENRNKIPLQGNSTFLLVKAKYNPEKWMDENGSEVIDPVTDGTFWRIKRGGSYTPEYYYEEPASGQVGSGEAVEYKEGITYYPIWLQTDGIYQVKRNGYYKIALTQVLSAGAPDLDSVIDPVAPLELDKETRSGGNNTPELTNGIRWIQGNI